MTSALLGLVGVLAISQVEPARFAERVPVVFEVTEELAADELIPLRRIAEVEPRVITRSNMVAEGLLVAISRFPSSQVVLRPPILRAHTEQLEQRLRVGAVIELASTPPDDALVAQVQRLGPRPITVRVASLDASGERLLSRLGAIEVEVDARGRTLGGEEVGRMLRLYRARRAVRLDATVAPEAVAGLSVLKPVTLIVETKERALPVSLRDALRAFGGPIRIRFDRLPTVEQVANALNGLRASIELPPTNGPELDPAAVDLVRGLGTPPAQSGE
jgi:hypothetical protein